MWLVWSVVCVLLCRVHGACVDMTAKGYWTNRAYSAGVPPVTHGHTYTFIPKQLSYCELEELHAHCVARLNLYRNGSILFTNGTEDPGVPKPPLLEAKRGGSCSSAQAFGDLSGSIGAPFRSDACDNAHKNSFMCPGKIAGQNSCCFRSGSTFDEIRTSLDQCFQLMWDEGTGLEDNVTQTYMNGHWWNMRSETYTYVSCGFAYAQDGALWMNQDFYTNGSEVLSVCSCSKAGTDDNCGGICVNADGSFFGDGNAVAANANSIAAIVMSLLAMIFVCGLLWWRGSMLIWTLEAGRRKALELTASLQIALFILAVAAVASPLWAEGNEVRFSLWSICVPTMTGEMCYDARFASSGSVDLLQSVRAFMILTVLTTAFCAIGYITARCWENRFPRGFKLLFGAVVFELASFWLSVCLFGGYFNDELSGFLSYRWGAGLPILAWFLAMPAAGIAWFVGPSLSPPVAAEHPAAPEEEDEDEEDGDEKEKRKGAFAPLKKKAAYAPVATQAAVAEVPGEKT